MTIGELLRAVESKQRQEKKRLRERANFDYILADLIGGSIARIYSSANHLPTIEEAYKGLFDEEEIKEERQKQLDEVSAIRFRQFAQQFNNNFKEV